MDKDKKETLQIIFSVILMILLIVILVLVITDKISLKKSTNTVNNNIDETSNVVETTTTSDVEYDFYGDWKFSGALLDDSDYDANMLFGSCLKENPGNITINEDGTFSVTIGCGYDLKGTYEIKSNENILLIDEDKNVIDVIISSDMLKFKYTKNYDDLDVDGDLYLKFTR